MDLYENRILEIIRSEGTEIPTKGRIVVMAPFMKKYGYEDKGGWWIKNSD